MAAEDNLSKQLFHGSIHPYKVGETINPGPDDLAWASSDPKVATQYAEMGNSRSVSKDERIKVKDNPVLFGTVYTVKPIKNDLISEDNIHASRTGFTVTGIHSLTQQRESKLLENG